MFRLEAQRNAHKGRCHDDAPTDGQYRSAGAAHERHTRRTSHEAASSGKAGSDRSAVKTTRFDTALRSVSNAIVEVRECPPFGETAVAIGFFAFLDAFPIPASIAALPKEAFIKTAWSIVGRKVSKVSKERLLSDIYEIRRGSCAMKGPVPGMPRRKALTAITAKMARVADAVVKSGSGYRPFVEGRVLGGRTSFCKSSEGATATL
jgi:hypothetical protein